MSGKPVKPTFRDCLRCKGKGWGPGDPFRTCLSCGGDGCHLVDPWPAGFGVFYWPDDPKEAERLRTERAIQRKN